MICIVGQCATGVPTQVYPAGSGTPKLPLFVSRNVIIQASNGNGNNIIQVSSRLAAKTASAVPTPGQVLINNSVASIDLSFGQILYLNRGNQEVDLSDIWITGPTGAYFSVLAL